MPNLFDLGRAGGAAEEFAALVVRPGLRIERIASHGQASPPDHWYDQDQAEWVVLLQGKAWIAFEDEAEPRALRPGDYVEIAPHHRHRVVATDPHALWLAVHFDDPPRAPS